MTIAAIVLAAGAGSRMGGGKLLLRYRNKSLIRHVTDAASDAGLNPLIIVTGADGDHVARALPLGAQREQNNEWPAGPGTSIRRGVRAIVDRPDVRACLILLGDQPRVTAEHLRTMIALYDEGPLTLVASEYDGVVGSPALFDRQWFGNLLALPDDSGARDLLSQHRSELAIVTLQDGELDVDTPDDYERLVGDGE